MGAKIQRKNVKRDILHKNTATEYDILQEMVLQNAIFYIKTLQFVVLSRMTLVFTQHLTLEKPFAHRCFKRFGLDVALFLRMFIKNDTPTSLVEAPNQPYSTQLSAL